MRLCLCACFLSCSLPPCSAHAPLFPSNHQPPHANLTSHHLCADVFSPPPTHTTTTTTHTHTPSPLPPPPKNNRFFARPLAELITSQGRDILQSTVDLVNDMGVPGLEVRRTGSQWVRAIA